MKRFEPMKAATLEGPLEGVRYPFYGSPKMDGYRAVVRDGRLLSSTLKPIPNKELTARYSRREFEGFDGELITGLPWASNAFNASSRVVRNANADASTTGFYVFDMHNLPGRFEDRLAELSGHVGFYSSTVSGNPDQLWLTEQRRIDNHVMAADYEAQWLGMGYEGLMGRAPEGLYKYGRSTMVEQWLFKVKRFQDAEAIIVDVLEEMENTNEAEKDAFGRVKRSTKQAGRVGKGTLGGFLVRGLNAPYKDRPFRVGPGVLTDEQAAALWAVRGSLPGRTLTYKFFPTGSVDAPRFSLFLKADWLVDLVDLGEAK